MTAAPDDWKITIDGKEYEWNGFCLTYSFDVVIPMPNKPTEEQARYAMLGWRAGYTAGKQMGRSQLQNEFRNLMDCQR